MAGVGTVHRVDHAQIVHALRDVRKQFADPEATLAMLLELPGGLEQIERLTRNNSRTLKRKWLSVVALQEWFVIEGVDLRGSAMHEKKNNSFGPRGEVRRPRRQCIGCCARIGLGSELGCRGFLTKQRRQRQSAESSTAGPQHFSP